MVENEKLHCRVIPSTCNDFQTTENSISLNIIHSDTK